MIYDLFQAIMNNIINDKKGHNIVNNSFAHKPDGLLVICVFTLYIGMFRQIKTVNDVKKT